MRRATAGMIMIALVLVAAPARAAGPRLSIGPVRGDAKAVVPAQLAHLLCGAYECVLWKDVSTRGPDLAKARALDVRGILTGVVEPAAGGKKVTLSLLTTSPRPAKTWTFPLTATGRLPASATRRLEQDLQALLRPPAPATAPAAAAPRAPPSAAATPPPSAPAPKPAEPAPLVLTAPRAPPGPPAERRWLVAAELGGFASQLKLTYGGVAASTGTLRRFDAKGMAGPGVSLELFPLAHGASAVLAGVGLHAGLAMSLGLRTEAAPGDSRRTQFTRLEVGVRWRAPPLSGLRLVLVPDVSWVSQKLTVSPAILGLPNGDLSGVRVALSAEAPVATRFTVLAGLGWTKWLTAKELIKGDPAFFPGSSAWGLEAEVGAGVAISGPLSVRILGQYASTRYTLDPDPTGTYAATSAESRSLGLRAVLRGEF
jgi:hypothetical protein